MNHRYYEDDTENLWLKSPVQRRSGAIALILFTLTGLGLWWWLK